MFKFVPVLLRDEIFNVSSVMLNVFAHACVCMYMCLFICLSVYTFVHVSEFLCVRFFEHKMFSFGEKIEEIYSDDLVKHQSSLAVTTVPQAADQICTFS